MRGRNGEPGVPRCAREVCILPCAEDDARVGWVVECSNIDRSSIVHTKTRRESQPLRRARVDLPAFAVSKVWKCGSQGRGLPCLHRWEPLYPAARGRVSTAASPPALVWRTSPCKDGASLLFACLDRSGQDVEGAVRRRPRGTSFRPRGPRTHGVPSGDRTLRGRPACLARPGEDPGWWRNALVAVAPGAGTPSGPRLVNMSTCIDGGLVTTSALDGVTSPKDGHMGFCRLCVW